MLFYHARGEQAPYKEVSGKAIAVSSTIGLGGGIATTASLFFTGTFGIGSASSLGIAACVCLCVTGICGASQDAAKTLDESTSSADESSPLMVHGSPYQDIPITPSQIHDVPSTPSPRG